jgi:hypothetical protein
MGEKEKRTGTTKHAKQGRKPYHAPAFRSEKVFETMALTCGKISATQTICKLNRKNS